jgi:hypothetical protein
MSIASERLGEDATGIEELDEQILDMFNKADANLALGKPETWGLSADEVRLHTLTEEARERAIAVFESLTDEWGLPDEGSELYQEAERRSDETYRLWMRQWFIAECAGQCRGPVN